MIRSATTLSLLLHAATIGIVCLAVGTRPGAPGLQIVRMEVQGAEFPLPPADRALPEPTFTAPAPIPPPIVPIQPLQPFTAPKPRPEAHIDPRRSARFERELVRVVAPPRAAPQVVTPQVRAAPPPVAVVVAARPLEAVNVPPYYPRLAQRRGVEGRVIVVLDLDATGLVIGARVAESSGSEVLDAAALNALAAWRFSPATRDGRPVAATWRQIVEFRIGS